MDTPAYCQQLMDLSKSFLDDDHQPRAAILLGVLHRCAFGCALDEDCAPRCQQFIQTSLDRMPSYRYNKQKETYLPN